MFAIFDLAEYLPYFGMRPGQTTIQFSRDASEIAWRIIWFLVFGGTMLIPFLIPVIVIYVLIKFIQDVSAGKTKFTLGKTVLFLIGVTIVVVFVPIVVQVAPWFIEYVSQIFEPPTGGGASMPGF